MMNESVYDLALSFFLPLGRGWVVEEGERGA